ncbi:MAG: type II toxin-antitoxin system VapC family toxin [Euryarchaeota archaeon]|nr:type II toxin-antitoxin system VapC family toxin [Euryarchaeota archaeon]
MTVTFDSSAWIEYFAGTKKGKTVKEILEGNDQILTSSICLLEIKNKYIQEEQEFHDRIEFICNNSSIIEITKELALLGADMKQKHKLYTVDALIYATAQIHRSTLLTGDAHFKNLKNVILL